MDYGVMALPVGRYVAKCEPVYNEVLNELYFLITWYEGSVFVAAYDQTALSIKIQGPAPYEAREMEDYLSDKITGWFE